MPKLIGLDWDAESTWEIRNKGWYEMAQLGTKKAVPREIDS
jgi:hypothetical protein